MRYPLIASIALALMLTGCGNSEVEYSVSQDMKEALATRSVVQTQKFRTVSVGMDIPSFGAISMNDAHITPTTPEGNFFIHVIQPDLPPVCLDEECGESYAAVSDKGGHLFGFSDGKAASSFDIKIQPGIPYDFDDTLVVVTDRRGKILALFEHAKMSNVPVIVDGISFK